MVHIIQDNICVSCGSNNHDEGFFEEQKDGYLGHGRRCKACGHSTIEYLTKTTTSTEINSDGDFHYVVEEQSPFTNKHYY